MFERRHTIMVGAWYMYLVDYCVWILQMALKIARINCGQLVIRKQQQNESDCAKNVQSNRSNIVLKSIRGTLQKWTATAYSESR